MDNYSNHISNLHSGNMTLVLHSHMPWVLGHGGWPHGEDWLSEAIAECYIPLLNAFNKLVDEGISPNITIGISPVLCEMLSNEEYKSRFIDYCLNKVELAKIDQKNFERRLLNDDGSPRDFHNDKELLEIKDLILLSIYWQNFFNNAIIDYTDKFNKDILGAFRILQDNNHIEIITCGATHGYFPLLATESSIRFQIKVAVENYTKHFGRKPKGIWLPECAYRNSYEWKTLIPVAPFDTTRLRAGVETFLDEFGIEFFITDEALTKQSELLGWYADDSKNYFLTKEQEHQEYIFKPNPLKLYNVASGVLSTNESSVAFTRDVSLALQVWSGEIGYPADGVYLDFHKKEMNSMLRYWGVTSVKLDMAFKEVYQPLNTQKSVDLQSNHYIHLIEETAKNFKRIEGQNATICLPFDTELYGHWWFEGVNFLYSLLRGVYYSPYINSEKCSTQIEITKPKEVIKLKEGSWGENNNHDVWSNPQTYWIWEHIYNSEVKLQTLFRKLNKNLCVTITDLVFNNTNHSKISKNSISELSKFDRLVKQMMRENLLLQASDLSFLVTTQSAKDYAEMRFTYHLSDFNKFYEIVNRNLEKVKSFIETNVNDSNLEINFELNLELSNEEMEYLAANEKRNSIFIELEYNWFDIDNSLNHFFGE